jgi:hypothetical protein
MKTFTFLLHITFYLLLCSNNSNAQSNSNFSASNFFQSIDLNRPDMSSISNLVGQGNYNEALELWRDTVINRLRRLDLGQFNWHSNCLNGYYVNFAKMLVEKITPQTYYAGSVSYYDYFNLTNSPYDPIVDVNWLASPPNGMQDNDDDIATYMMFIPLPATYYSTSDTIYLKKFMQVSSDFASRQKNLITALSSSNQNLYSPNWKRNAAEALMQGDRVSNIIKCLAVLSKNLPGEPKIATWNNVLNTPRTKVVNQNASQRVI